MIKVSLGDHWRIRRSEWMLSLCTLSLGLVWLTRPGLMLPQYFALMLSLWAQDAWGQVAAALGLFRLAMLLINGAWRASPHLRILGALASIALWLALLLNALAASAPVQSVGFWAIFFGFDMFSIIDAAGDARMADEKARENKMTATSRAGAPV